MLVINFQEIAEAAKDALRIGQIIRPPRARREMRWKELN